MRGRHGGPAEPGTGDAPGHSGPGPPGPAARPARQPGRRPAGTAGHRLVHRRPRHHRPAAHRLGLPGHGHRLPGPRPRLAAAVHAAGTVKGHIRPEVWQRGIAVSSAADANAVPVVEYTLATIWLAARRTLGAAAGYRTGRYPGYRERQGADGAVVGVIGASRIGRGVIARLLTTPAGFRILLADPYVTAAEAAALGAEQVDPDELCRRSDIVTIHAPDLPETRHLLDARRLRLLRDGAAVINTARGRLIDTQALTAACAAGRIDAYLDVTDPEPLPRTTPSVPSPTSCSPRTSPAARARRCNASARTRWTRWSGGSRGNRCWARCGRRNWTGSRKGAVRSRAVACGTATGGHRVLAVRVLAVC